MLDVIFAASSIRLDGHAERAGFLSATTERGLRPHGGFRHRASDSGLRATAALSPTTLA